jgi:hypothetical protein
MKSKLYSLINEEGGKPHKRELKDLLRYVQGTEGEASSPLRYGFSVGTMPCRSGELASPVCPTKREGGRAR